MSTSRRLFIPFLFPLINNRCKTINPSAAVTLISWFEVKHVPVANSENRYYIFEPSVFPTLVAWGWGGGQIQDGFSGIFHGNYLATTALRFRVIISYNPGSRCLSQAARQAGVLGRVSRDIPCYPKHDAVIPQDLPYAYGNNPPPDKH